MPVPRVVGESGMSELLSLGGLIIGLFLGTWSSQVRRARADRRKNFGPCTHPRLDESQPGGYCWPCGWGLANHDWWIRLWALLDYSGRIGWIKRSVYALLGRRQ